MIKAPLGYRAVYAHSSPEPHTTTKDVVAFDNQGGALVLGDRDRLVAASSYTNFKEIQEPGDSDQLWGYIEHVIPGGGWMERYTWTNEEGSKVYADQPVVAWVVAGGVLQPIGTDSEGSVDELASGSLVWHPDATGQPPVPPGAVPASPRS